MKIDKQQEVIIVSLCFCVSALILLIIWTFLAFFLSIYNFLFGYVIALFFAALIYVARFKAKAFIFVGSSRHNRESRLKGEAIIWTLFAFAVNLLLFGSSFVLAIFVDKWSFSSIHASLISNLVTNLVLYLVFIGSFLYISYQ